MSNSSVLTVLCTLWKSILPPFLKSFFFSSWDLQFLAHFVRMCNILAWFGETSFCQKSIPLTVLELQSSKGSVHVHCKYVHTSCTIRILAPLKPKRWCPTKFSNAVFWQNSILSKVLVFLPDGCQLKKKSAVSNIMKKRVCSPLPKRQCWSWGRSRWARIVISHEYTKPGGSVLRKFRVKVRVNHILNPYLELIVISLLFCVFFRILMEGFKNF